MLNPSKSKPKDDSWEETLEFHDGATGNSLRLFDRFKSPSLIVNNSVFPKKFLNSISVLSAKNENEEKKTKGNQSVCNIFFLAREKINPRKEV